MEGLLLYLAPVLVFGLVVFVHEFGHFLAAKLVGVYAPRFSIGFGPAIWAHRWGETEYRLAVLPFGGYVRMASRDDETAAMLEGGTEEKPAVATGGDPEAMMPFGPRPVPPDRWFESKPLPARLVIMLAGVFMNAVLTFVIFSGLALYYGEPTASTAPVIERVMPKSAAVAAGLAAGDSIAAVASQPIRTWDDFVQHISSMPGQPVPLTVWSRGHEHSLTVTPRATVDTNPTTGVVRTVGRIGAARRLDRHPMPLNRAIGDAGRSTWRAAGLIVLTLRQLATTPAAWHSLSGPLGIAKASVDAARSGFADLLFLIAILSINVAVFNLLPIPILDGGQVLINVAEAIKGRPFSLQTREAILRIGLVTIAVLFLLVMYNDRCQFFSALCSSR
jgi:regulator of sigma E protease